jgi:hypothetical protein
MVSAMLLGMKRIERFLILIAFLMANSAIADPPKVPAHNPCSDDIDKYCSDVTPGGGRLAKCMKDHAAELSSGCKTFGKKYKKEHPEIEKEIENAGKKS